MGAKLEDARKAILKQLNVPEETITFLENISVPLLREWSYLCIAEGMPKESIDSVCQQTKENKLGASEIFLQERERNLRSRYENNRELGDRFEKLQGEVKAMHRRADSVETSLDEVIQKAFRDKDNLYGKIIEGKDEVLKEKDKQIAALEKQLADMKDRDKTKDDLVHRLEDRLKTAEIKLESEGKYKEQAPGVRDAEEREGETNPLYERETVHPMEPLIPVIPSVREDYYPGLPKRRLFPWKKDRETEQFIRQFMENEDYTDEQKDFLIRCLEKGDSMEFIREYASPKLSVDHMAWLRKIVGGRIRYGR